MLSNLRKLPPWVQWCGLVTKETAYGTGISYERKLEFLAMLFASAPGNVVEDVPGRCTHVRDLKETWLSILDFDLVVAAISWVKHYIKHSSLTWVNKQILPFSFLRFIYFHYKVRYTERRREREKFIWWPTPQVPAAGVSLIRSQEPGTSSKSALQVQDPKAWAILGCFPRLQAGSWMGIGAGRIRTGTHMRTRCI